MTNIYLDIDGVLLDDGKPAKHVDDFLSYVLEEYPETTYWLTTRCNGDASEVLRQIQPLFTQDTQKLLEMIKPTSWPMVKTQAIDFSQAFLWYDDQLGWADEKALKDHDAMDSLRRIDLESNPDQLNVEFEVLKQRNLE